MLKRWEEYFEFARLGTSWRTEILAGVTTFLTMAYIVLVNPAILTDAGVALPAGSFISAAFGPTHFKRLSVTSKRSHG